MNTIYPARLLKLALTADALVSGAVAVLQLIAAGWLSDLFGLPKPLLTETGVFLVGYTILLIVLARSTTLWFSVIGVVVLGNIGWAVGCVVLMVSGVLPRARSE
jgi:MFS family permease